MITVTHEIVVPSTIAHVETKTFNLIELDLFYKNFRVMLQVPANIGEDRGSSLQAEANCNLIGRFNVVHRSWGL